MQPKSIFFFPFCLVFEKFKGKKYEKNKNRFKIKKLFLYIYLNSFNLFYYII